MAENDNVLSEELDDVLDNSKPAFEALRETNIFITGGTGFFGAWFLETFLWANRKLDLGAHVTVLTRNLDNFRTHRPHLATRGEVTFEIGDLRSLKHKDGKFKYIIHAATESSAILNSEHPEIMLETAVQGTRNILDFAKAAECEHFLLTSSGVVYGPQPANTTNLSEDYSGSPDVLSIGSAYPEGKRFSELLCAITARQTNIKFKIARCFAFVGPYLPLDRHFAIGNFINNGLKGEPIKISGDGTPMRSYLYASDLMVWLWTILVFGENLRPYNVGSEESFSILEIAQEVQKQFVPAPEIEVAQKANSAIPVNRYVPSTQRAQSELKLKQIVSLADALRLTVDWNRTRL